MSDFDKEREIEKERLLNAFIGIAATYRTKEIRAINGELKAFVKTYGGDRQIDDLLGLIKMIEMSRRSFDFHKICLIVRPILKRLDDQATWELTDLRILSVSTLSTMDFALFSRLFDRALTLLKTDYATAPFHEKAITALYHNSTRVLLELYHLSMNDDDGQAHKQIKNMLTKHFDIAHKRLLAVRDTDQMYQYFYGVCLVRKGLFIEDQKLIDQGMALVKKHGEQSALRQVIEQKESYEYQTHQILGMSPFLKQLGANVRRHRKRLNLTMEELAELANIHPNTVSNIEQAEQATSIFILLKISKALGVSTDELMFGSVAQQLEKSSDQMKDLFRLADQLDPAQLEILTGHASYLHATNKNNALQSQ